MEERLARIEAELDRQRVALEELLRRLDALETRIGEGSLPNAEVPVDRRAVKPHLDAEPASSPRSGIVGFVGRTLIALGGAYLLRALTEGGTLPGLAGVSLGFAYAACWIFVAGRAGRLGRRRSASFHLLTAAATGLPLLWETSTRLGLLPASVAAALLSLLALSMLGASWRSDLHGAAWATTSGSLATAFLLLVSTAHRIPFAWVLLLLAAALLAVSRSRGWQALAWVGALVADAGVLVVGVLAVVSPAAAAHPGRVVVLQMALLVLFSGSFAWLLLRRGKPVDGFVLTQSVAGLAMGFGGALVVALANPTLAPALGLASLLLALGCYALAFLGLSRDRRPAFYLLSTEGLALGLGSGVLLWFGRPLAWILFGLMLAVLARLFSRRSLSLHSAVYLLAAAVASGGLTWTAVACVARASYPLEPFPFSALLVIGATVAAMRLDLGVAQSAYWGRVRALPLGVLLATGAWLALGSGLAVITSARWLAAWSADGGILAVLRTALLGVAAIGLLLLARAPGMRVATLLGRATLVAGGLKLLIDDLPHGRPSTLFPSLAIYGLALIIGSRLARGEGGDAADAPPPEGGP